MLPAVRLAAVLSIARPGELLGVWTRGARHALRLRINRRDLLIGTDLGALLRRCNRIAVRCQGHPVVVEAGELIAWRTLRVVTGTPCLRGLDDLRFLVPGLAVSGVHLTLPLGLDCPEEMLAACAAAAVPVVASRIEYRG